MGFNLKDAVAQAKAKGQDMTKAQKGGGDFELPPEGFVSLRFMQYIETGDKESTWQGVKKVKPGAELVFELSGPKHQPREIDGVKYPHMVTERVNISLSENAALFKLFTAMNWEGKATHIAELLGQPFIGRIEHNPTKIDGKDFTYINIRDIRKPFVPNVVTGEEDRVEVAQPISQQRLFLWNFATPEMWDALYIEGMTAEKKNDKGEVIREARSKNVIQEKIRRALNWKGCPIYDYANSKISKADNAALDAAIGGVEEAGAPSDTGSDPLDGVA
jgi:hypothetical protein